MLTAIGFHLDEHVHRAIAIGLRIRDIDVSTTADAGLLGADDSEHIAHANASQRVIFTQDADFLRMHSVGVPHHGIVFAPREGRSIGEIVRGLVLIHECMTRDEMKDHLEYL
jgi:hypothetical protein